MNKFNKTNYMFMNLKLAHIKKKNLKHFCKHLVQIAKV